MNAPITFVTGLGCSGKSTYAETNFATVVHIDKIKFGPNWQRVPSSQVLTELIRLADEANPNVPIAFEGLYHDPTCDATRKFLDHLIHSNRLVRVVCFRPPATALEQATRIMTRSFNRLLGSCVQNETGNVERPANVARMMEKTFGHFGDCCTWLDSLENDCKKYNVPFEWHTSPAMHCDALRF